MVLQAALLLRCCAARREGRLGAWQGGAPGVGRQCTEELTYIWVVQATPGAHGLRVVPGRSWAMQPDP